MTEPLFLDDTSKLPTDAPFTRAMARQWGVGDKSLHRLVIAGYLRRPIRGVYVAAQVTETIALRCFMLSLVVPRDAFVCDRTAAWLHAGDRALAPNEHLTPPPISCFLPSDAGRLRNKLAQSGEREISERDLEDIHGVLVTTPLRTALDLGRMQKTRDLRLHGMDTMLGLRVFRHDEMLAEVRRFNRRRGVVMLRALAPLADGGSESFGESALRLRWYDASLPRPQTQVPVIQGGREVARLDIGLEGLRFAAEYDGEEWHDGDQQPDDEDRREWLGESHGWAIEVFRKEHVFGRLQNAEIRLRRAFASARETYGVRTYLS
jgi:hypothetical protein